MRNVSPTIQKVSVPAVAAMPSSQVVFVASKLRPFSAEAGTTKGFPATVRVTLPISAARAHGNEYQPGASARSVMKLPRPETMVATFADDPKMYLQVFSLQGLRLEGNMMTHVLPLSMTASVFSTFAPPEAAIESIVMSQNFDASLTRVYTSVEGWYASASRSPMDKDALATRRSKANKACLATPWVTAVLKKGVQVEHASWNTDAPGIPRPMMPS